MKYTLTATEWEPMPSRTKRKLPAGAMRVVCDGDASSDVAYLPEPAVVQLAFRGCTRATIECGLPLDDLRKSDLVKIAKSLGIDHDGRKSDIVARISSRTRTSGTVLRSGD
jgi:hypothetical protein